jgi:hypothetical protein
MNPSLSLTKKRQVRGAQSCGFTLLPRGAQPRFGRTLERRLGEWPRAVLCGRTQAPGAWLGDILGTHRYDDARCPDGPGDRALTLGRSFGDLMLPQARHPLPCVDAPLHGPPSARHLDPRPDAESTPASSATAGSLRDRGGLAAAKLAIDGKPLVPPREHHDDARQSKTVGSVCMQAPFLGQWRVG